MKPLRASWAMLKRVGRWIADRLKDLFYGPGNASLDIGRFIAFCATFSLLAAAVWNMYLRQPIDLGPMGLGGGLGAVLTAAVIYIWKDRAERGGG